MWLTAGKSSIINHQSKIPNTLRRVDGEPEIHFCRHARTGAQPENGLFAKK
jgi:hypothetical protein